MGQAGSGFLMLMALYGLAGVVFAAAFHLGVARRIDPGVAGGSAGFRCIITPGVIALWPLLLRAWLGVRRGAPAAPHPERTVSAAGLRRAHGALARALAILLPLAVVPALLFRPVEAPPSAGAASRASKPVSARVVAEFAAPFPGVDASLQLLEGAGGRRVRVILGKPLAVPGLVLLWRPGAGAPDVPDRLVLGAAGDAGATDYRLPDDGAGMLSLASPLTDGELGTVAVPPRDPAGRGGS